MRSLLDKTLNISSGCKQYPLECRSLYPFEILEIQIEMLCRVHGMSQALWPITADLFLDMLRVEKEYTVMLCRVEILRGGIWEPPGCVEYGIGKSSNLCPAPVGRGRIGDG